MWRHEKAHTSFQYVTSLMNEYQGILSLKNRSYFVVFDIESKLLYSFRTGKLSSLKSGGKTS